MKKQKKRHRMWHTMKTGFIVLFSVGLVSLGALLLWAALIPLPDFHAFEERVVAQSTKIYDRTGEVLLYDVHEDITRTVVDGNEIAQVMKDATIAIEDATFYEHAGVRPLATLRAVFLQPVRGKGVQGGSTITQQVIKNTLLTNERTVQRKIKEWVLSFRLEQVYSKDDILTLYLNEAPYGGTIYGIEEASLAFFGVNASELTLPQAAVLAALPQAPTYYSPYGNNTPALGERKNLVLYRMFEEGMISEKEYSDAKKEEIVFLPQRDTGIKAPHFVMYVISYLEETYGKEVIEQGGLEVITTLDYELQAQAEEIVNRYALENTEKFNAENAGLIATDPKTGQILVMVGSRDYFDPDIDGNFNVAIDPNRQPGSAFKPFVYATAFEKGYTPDTVVFDLPTVFDTRCNPDGTPAYSEVDAKDCYAPVNYDGKYSGPISLRDALAQSVNVPAVKTLYLAGLQDSLQTAKDMGISGLGDIGQYGLTLVLGGGEVSLLDMTNAYGTFASEGVYQNESAILSITDSSGRELETWDNTSRRVIDTEITRLISDVLSDNTARTPAFGANSYLHFGNRDVAVKTGTTNDYRDAWIIGYTPSLSVGAWAGNNDNSPMEKKVAGFIIAPLWNEFMQIVLETLPYESFTDPAPTNKQIPPVLRGIWQGGKTYTIDAISGNLATKYTPEETREEIAIENVHTILYWVDRDNPLTQEQPTRPEKDPQFILWEEPVLAWAQKEGYNTGGDTSIPTTYDSIHIPENIPDVTILEPKKKGQYTSSEFIDVELEYESTYPITKIDFFVNGMFIGSSHQSPFSFSFSPQQISNIQTENTLKVIATDAVFNKGESTTQFKVW
ncbi:MAG: penicillin-binding protein [Parcubacteria group bacterium]|nr:penicillin-binding protein [Parcubacteria group bacterium]